MVVTFLTGGTRSTTPSQWSRLSGSRPTVTVSRTKFRVITVDGRLTVTCPANWRDVESKGETFYPCDYHRLCM